MLVHLTRYQLTCRKIGDSRIVPNSDTESQSEVAGTNVDEAAMDSRIVFILVGSHADGKGGLEPGRTRRPYTGVKMVAVAIL